MSSRVGSRPFLAVTAASHCGEPEVRAHTRAPGGTLPTPSVPPNTPALTLLAPPSGPRACNDAQDSDRGIRHVNHGSRSSYFSSFSSSCVAGPEVGAGREDQFFKLSEMDIFKRRTFGCALSTRLSPAIPRLNPPPRAAYPSRLLIPPVLARRRAASATSSRRPLLDEYLTQM
eukprot:363301-Prymnesium_polylepis.1